MAEAVAAYTRNAAAALGQAADMGHLTVGARADLVVLDRNIYTCPPHEIHQARVDLTLVGGEVVYQR